MTSSLRRNQAVLPKPGEKLVGVQQPNGAQDAEEARRLAGYGREERNDRSYVRKRCRMQELAHAAAADRQSRQEVGEDDQAEGDVEPLQHEVVGHKRRGHDEQDGSNVESQQRIAEALSRAGLRLVEVAEPVDDALRVLFKHGVRVRPEDIAVDANNGLITPGVPTGADPQWRGYAPRGKVPFEGTTCIRE